MCIKWFKKKEQQIEKEQVENPIHSFLAHNNIKSLIRVDKNNYIATHLEYYESPLLYRMYFEIITFTDKNIVFVNNGFKFDSYDLTSIHSVMLGRSCNGKTCSQTCRKKVCHNWLHKILENNIKNSDYTDFYYKLWENTTIKESIIEKETDKINWFNHIDCYEIINKIKQCSSKQDCATQRYFKNVQYFFDDKKEFKNMLEDIYDKRINLIDKYYKV